MAEESSSDRLNFEIATKWCDDRGPKWKLLDTAGRGGTAPVFTVESPDGIRALKLMDDKYSSGILGEETHKRLKLQVERLGEHDCPYLIKAYEHGQYEGRHFLVMNKAEGSELAKKLHLVPREKISTIVDQVARAMLFLHDKGLSHRDVKSANIFVTDDFAKATLLDTSVVRDIDDPVGLGTDHGDKLPVVATSRYSPPEYLFRLIQTGRELWHALDIYQLGGLLHDLIMREEMFEQEYMESSSNKYRFAWLVATKTPQIQAADVDRRLLFLGNRALDKNWKRRSALKVSDFLADAENKGRLGLAAIGFVPQSQSTVEKRETVSLRQIVITIASELQDSVLAYQKEYGITATHKIVDGSTDNSQMVSFSWRPLTGSGKFHLHFELRAVLTENDAAEIRAGASFGDDGPSNLTMDLPPVAVDEDAGARLFSMCVSAIESLASRYMDAGGDADVVVVGK